MTAQRYEYLYTDSTPDSVKCAKCHEIPERVYRDCELELLFCQNCRSRTSMYDTYLQHILDQCLVMCPNTDCDLICKRGELLVHLAEQCEKQIMPCENSDVGCKWFGKRQEHEDHECQFDFIASTLRSMKESIFDSSSLTRENEMLRKRIEILESNAYKVPAVIAAPFSNEGYVEETVEYSPPLIIKKKRVMTEKPIREDMMTIHDKILSELQQRLKLRVN
eukprot:NODE_106_length_19060_cov_0.700227.p13 type:complete len:221 gc:universal NODE_106_length_19060_cov_0.700227:14488-15150(+)